MAHTKAGGSTRQKGNRHGQRLGVKVFGSQRVLSGNIIVRQKGSNILPGTGAKLSRNYDIYATLPGLVKYFIKKGRQYVSIVSS